MKRIDRKEFVKKRSVVVKFKEGVEIVNGNTYDWNELEAVYRPTADNWIDMLAGEIDFSELYVARPISGRNIKLQDIVTKMFVKHIVTTNTRYREQMIDKNKDQ